MPGTSWIVEGREIIHRCASCGKQNRVPPQHLTHAGKCGACAARLPPLDVPLEVDAATFDAVVHGTSAPILVDFWAAWCSPCRMIAPEVAAFAAAHAGRSVALKVDTERHPQLAQRFGVSSIPNLLFFKDGRMRLQKAGAVGRQQLDSWMSQIAA